MPFVSQAQQRACWARYNSDIKAGVKPTWNCPSIQKETPKYEKLPKQKIYTGPNGGKYFIRKSDGKKIYLKKKSKR